MSSLRNLRISLPKSTEMKIPNLCLVLRKNKEDFITHYKNT